MWPTYAATEIKPPGMRREVEAFKAANVVSFLVVTSLELPGRYPRLKAINLEQVHFHSENILNHKQNVEVRNRPDRTALIFSSPNLE